MTIERECASMGQDYYDYSDMCSQKNDLEALLMAYRGIKDEMIHYQYIHKELCELLIEMVVLTSNKKSLWSDRNDLYHLRECLSDYRSYKSVKQYFDDMDEVADQILRRKIKNLDKEIDALDMQEQYM